MRLPATAPSSLSAASMKSCTPSSTRVSPTLAMSMPASARHVMTRSAPATSSSMALFRVPWSRNASMVAGGMVLTVSGPISSST